MRKILWGMFFIIMAVMLVLGQIMEISGVASIIFTIFLVVVLIESIISKNLFFSLTSIAVIAIVNKEYLNLEELSNVSILAVAVLLSIGLSILFDGKSKKNRFKEETSSDSKDVVDMDVSFGSSIKYITSDDFKKAIIRCNFAGAQVYLDGATIQGDSAEIELDVSFSGLELYIPKEWKVINNARVSLGGIDEKNRYLETTKTIVLTGRVNLAGVEIRYV